MCGRCSTTLSCCGNITQLGGEVREGLTPASGDCGAVYVPGVSLPPKPSKFVGFGDTFVKKRLRVKIGGQKWRVVNPDHWDRGLPKQPEDRTRAVLAGMAIAGATPAVSNLDCYNATKAVLARVLRCPKHTANPAVWRAAVDRIPDLLPPSFFTGYKPMSVEEWLATMPTRRKMALRRAWVNVNRTGFSCSWRWFAAFVKSEKLPGFDKWHDCLVPAKQLIDRLIQGPSDEAHILAGPYIKPVMTQLKKAWHEYNPIFYGGVSPDKLNQWFNLNYNAGDWAICCDYTMFDNSHSEHSWAFVEHLYYLLGIPALAPHFQRVMDWWRQPVGRVNGKGWSIKYKARVMNASGRDDTAFANGVLNGVAFYLSACSSVLAKQVTQLSPADIAGCGDKIRLSVCGDDSLCLLKVDLSDPQVRAEMARSLSANLGLFGFDAGAEKMLITNDPFKMVYLGMRPYPVDGRWWFARTIGRALWKQGWVMDGADVDCPARVTGDCVAIAKTQAVVPVLSDYAHGYLKSREGCKRLLPEPDPNRPWTTGVETPPYTQETLSYVAAGYGVDIRSLLDCCQMLRDRRSFPWVSDHPVLLTMVTVDDL